LNESLLQQIATVTGGFYLPLRGANTMDTLYERGLEPLPKSEGKEKLIRHYHEQFQWPLGIAILLLLAEMFLPERSLRMATMSKGKAIAATTLIVFLFLPFAADASSSSALHDYKSGNYTNVLEQFQQLAQTQTNDWRLIFNAGDAAYRMTNFALAQNLFQQVTLSSDLQLQQQAFYNLGNAQFQAARDAKDLDGLEQGLEIAQKSYERAVNLNTNDVDASFNLAFTKNAIEQIKNFRAAIQHAKAQADEAVRRAEFHRALEIIAPLQKTIAAKQFQDFTKKLKDIDDIATPHQP
jgi:Ca-activated chloride channel family protein